MTSDTEVKSHLGVAPVASSRSGSQSCVALSCAGVIGLALLKGASVVLAAGWAASGAGAAVPPLVELGDVPPCVVVSPLVSLLEAVDVPLPPVPLLVEPVEAPPSVVGAPLASLLEAVDVPLPSVPLLLEPVEVPPSVAGAPLALLLEPVDVPLPPVPLLLEPVGVPPSVAGAPLPLLLEAVDVPLPSVPLVLEPVGVPPSVPGAPFSLLPEPVDVPLSPLSLLLEPMDVPLSPLPLLLEPVDVPISPFPLLLEPAGCPPGMADAPVWKAVGVAVNSAPCGAAAEVPFGFEAVGEPVAFADCNMGASGLAGTAPPALEPGGLAAYAAVLNSDAAATDSAAAAARVSRTRSTSSHA